MGKQTVVNNNFSIWLSFALLMITLVILFMSIRYQIDNTNIYLSEHEVYEHVITDTYNGVPCKGEIWRNGIMVFEFDNCNGCEDSESFGNIVMVDDRDYEDDSFTIVSDYNIIGYLCPDSTGYVYSFESIFK